MRVSRGRSRSNGFTPAELRLLSRLRTPGSIQTFIDTEVGYNVEATGETCRSPRRVMRDRVAQCMEGALFAAAALRFLGFPPLILDMESVRDLDMESVRDDDHVLAVFCSRGLGELSGSPTTPACAFATPSTARCVSW